MTISASVSGEVHDRVGQIESLITELDALPDPAVRAVATEALQAVLELHGAALDRMLELVAEAGEQGSALLASFAGDDLVGNVLMLHGLHPVDIRTRVAQALDSVRPYLESHGGDVELLGVDDGVVRLRLEGSCKGCPSSAATLKTAIEEAIMAAAPDAVEITAEGVTPPAARPPGGLVPLPMMGAAGAPPPVPPRAGGGGPARGAWTGVAEGASVAPGEARRVAVEGVPLVLCRLQGTLYAYRVPCPGCGDPLEGAWVAAGNLVCPGCSRAYDVRGAGRCTQDSTRLEPLPLLEEAGGVRVAIPVGTR